MRNFIFISFFILVTIIIVNNYSKNPHLVNISGKTMGNISYNIKYLDFNNINYKRNIDSILVSFNNSLSTYIPESEISNFNNSDTLNNISNTLFNILDISKNIYYKTFGAFDPTIGTLVNLWGFGPEKIVDIPDTLLIINSLKNVGFEQVYFDNKVAIRNNSKTNLDFSAIAKGYAVDILAEFLLEKNIQDFMIEIGGEVKCNGNQNKNNWLIGIESPYDHNNTNKPIAVVNLINKSLATSGNYRNFYINNNIKISHTIDPRTGFPSNSNLLSASVFHANCVQADAYATAFMVLGLDQSIKIIENNKELDALLIYTDDSDSIKIYVSKNIIEYVDLL